MCNFLKAQRKISYCLASWLLAFICILQSGYFTPTAFAAGTAELGVETPVDISDAAGVAAAPVPRFADVPADAPYANDVYELVQSGIIFGAEPDRFNPEGHVTGLQVLVSCHRMLAKEDPDIPSMLEYAVDYRYVNPDIDVDWALTKEQAVALVLRRIGALPSCNHDGGHIYTDKQGYEFAQLVGQECGLFTLDYADLTAVMTRKEYAMFLNKFRHLYFERPELFEKTGFDYIPVSAVERYAHMLPATWGYLLNVPAPVLKAYHDSGYSIEINNGPLIEYKEDHDMQAGLDVVGLFSTGRFAIYVKTPYAIMHEMGHFVEKFMSGIDLSEKYYKLEGAGCSDLLGSYAKTNNREFFGEAFRFFIRNRGDVMQMDLMRGVMPQTYQYLLALEANNYLRPGETRFQPNNFSHVNRSWFEFD